MIARLFEHPASLAVVIVVIVLLLGWKRLPDMARSAGRSARILKSEVDELRAETEARKPLDDTVKRDEHDGSATRVD